MVITCKIWTADTWTLEQLNADLEQVEQLEDDSDLRHSIRRGKHSGQLYFYEFKEHLNWSTGIEKVYRTWIPITDLAAGYALNELSSTALLGYASLRQDRGSQSKIYKVTT